MNNLRIHTPFSKKHSYAKARTNETYSTRIRLNSELYMEKISIYKRKWRMKVSVIKNNETW